MKVPFEKLSSKKKAPFVLVFHEGKEIGRIWSERVRVLNRNSTIVSETRWFGELHGLDGVVGRGEYASLLFGSGYRSQDRAAKEVVKLMKEGGLPADCKLRI